MIHIGKINIRRIYYLGSVSSVLFVALAFSLVFIQSLNNEHKEKITQLAAGIIKEKERFLQNAVDRTIYLIKSEKELVENDNKNNRLNPQQIDEIVIERVSTQIRNLRLIDNGYVWVNHIVNYDGGDNYAIRQIHPNLPHTEGTFLSTHTTDIQGNRPYEIELNGIKKNGELFFQYYFKELNSDKISRKLSYAKLYKPYDWVIATGVYLDDVDQLVAIETKKMQETHGRRFLIAMLISGCSVLVSIVILIRFEKQISRLIEYHEEEIKNQTNKLIEEHEKTTQALTEVNRLKGMLPICSSCKKIRDDNGYWDQIESYIDKHSDISFTHGYCPQCYEKEMAKLDVWKKKMDTEG